jgi:hypothetical protein
MTARTVLATLPGGGPDQRLQVSLAQRGDGRLSIVLCEQHYAEGIGWFDQRTMGLEPRQLRQLQAVLGMKADVIEEAEAEAPVILAFPTSHPDEPRRAAVGDGS